MMTVIIMMMIMRILMMDIGNKLFVGLKIML